MNQCLAESFNGCCYPFGMDLHNAKFVTHPAADAASMGQPVDKGTKAYPLYMAAEANT